SGFGGLLAVVEGGGHLVLQGGGLAGDGGGDAVDEGGRLVAVELLAGFAGGDHGGADAEGEAHAEPGGALEHQDAFRPLRLTGLSPLSRWTARRVPVPTASALTTGLVNVRYARSEAASTRPPTRSAPDTMASTRSSSKSAERTTARSSSSAGSASARKSAAARRRSR